MTDIDRVRKGRRDKERKVVERRAQREILTDTDKHRKGGEEDRDGREKDT